MRQIIRNFDPAIEEVIALSTDLPAGSYCSNEPVALTRREVETTIRVGRVLMSDDHKAAALLMRGTLTWFLCPLELIPTSGKELLDLLAAPGSDVSGFVKNDAMRAAIHAARPDLSVEGQTVAATSEQAVTS